MRRRRRLEREAAHDAVAGTFAPRAPAAAAHGLDAGAVRRGAVPPARRAGHHRAPDRGQARHRAGDPPAHLPECWSSSSRRAGRRRERDDAGRAPARRDRPAVAHRRAHASSGPTVDARGRLGPATSSSETLFDVRAGAVWPHSTAALARQFPGEALDRRRGCSASARGSAATATATPSSPARVTRNTRGGCAGRAEALPHAPRRPAHGSSASASVHCRRREFLRRAGPRAGRQRPRRARSQQRNPGELFRQFIAAHGAAHRGPASRAPRHAEPRRAGPCECRRPARRARADAPRAGPSRGATRRWRRPTWRRCCGRSRLFRFATARLDLRQNSAVHQRDAGRAVGRGAGRPPSRPHRAAPAWKRLAADRAGRAAAQAAGAWDDSTACRAKRARRSASFRTDRRDAPPRRRARRSARFILSMTHGADDVLGVYLLAKQGGLFDDAEAAERCTLPVVPLLRDHPRPAACAGHPAGTAGGAAGAPHAAAPRATCRR